MYKLPSDFDGTFLRGSKLEMVSFNESQIYFQFNNDLLITVESSFSYYKKDQENVEIENVPVKSSGVIGLIGRTITKISWDENGTLELTFDSNEILKIFDSFPNYESYQIKKGDFVIIV